MRLGFHGPAAQRLPRHPDWNYEIRGGELHVSYRPRPLQVERDLSPVHGGAAHPVTECARDDPDLWAFLWEVWSGEPPFLHFEDPDAVFESERGWALRHDTGWPAWRVADGDEWIGAALTYAHPADGRPTLCWLTVHRAYRGRGAASALLAHLVDRAAGAGLATVRSEVSAGNRASLLWHWRHRFVALG